MSKLSHISIISTAPLPLLFLGYALLAAATFYVVVGILVHFKVVDYQ